jgi:hypothetical protein
MTTTFIDDDFFRNTLFFKLTLQPIALACLDFFVNSGTTRDVKNKDKDKGLCQTDADH